MLVRAVNILAACGVTTMVMPCNSLQPMHGRICADAGLRNVDVREATVRRVEALGLRKVALLSSRSNREDGFYEAALQQTCWCAPHMPAS